MNVEMRIAKLERLLTDVSQRRAQDPLTARGKPAKDASAAAWDSLERNFRVALGSLKQQRDTAGLVG